MKKQIAALLLWAAPAAAQQDFLASIFTEEGTELRNDERVFALYAMLNAAGYDAAPVARADPVARRKYHPVRAKVRDALRAMPADLRAKVEAFLDAHPVPIDTYLAQALALSGPPKFKPAEPTAPASVEGLDALLAELWAKGGLGKLFDAVRADLRAEAKRFQPKVDAPLVKARATVKGPAGDDAPRIIVALNALDDPGRAWARAGADEVLVVAGAGEGEPDLLPLARAYVEAAAGEKLAAAAALVKNGEEVWEKARLTASGREAAGASFAAHTRETFVRVAALHAVDRDAEVEALYGSGWWLAREALRLLTALEKMEGGDLGAYLAAEAPKVDARKAAAEFLKASGCFPAVR